MSNRATVPVIEEQLEVGKRVVDAGGARIVKTVQERVEVVDELLVSETIQIERIAVNAVVEAASVPVTRHEGDTLIVPVLEEVLVVEKRLMLKEELRLTRRRSETRTPDSVVLRTEHVTVERSEPLQSVGQAGTEPPSRSPRRRKPAHSRKGTS